MKLAAWAEAAVGYIDFVSSLSSSPEVVVVDFKTDAAPEGAVELAYPAYAEQVRTYARLVAGAAPARHRPCSPRPTVRCTGADARGCIGVHAPTLFRFGRSSQPLSARKHEDAMTTFAHFSADEAESALEYILPATPVAEPILRAFAGAIEVVAEVGPKMWAVTLGKHVVRLNFGPVEVFLVFRDSA